MHNIKRGLNVSGIYFSLLQGAELIKTDKNKTEQNFDIV